MDVSMEGPKGTDPVIICETEAEAVEARDQIEKVREANKDSKHNSSVSYPDVRVVPPTVAVWIGRGLRRWASWLAVVVVCGGLYAGAVAGFTDKVFGLQVQSWRWLLGFGMLLATFGSWALPRRSR